jgi:hypothetical protein
MQSRQLTVRDEKQGKRGDGVRGRGSARGRELKELVVGNIHDIKMELPTTR